MMNSEENDGPSERAVSDAEAAENRLLRELDGTRVCDELREIRSLYQNLEEKQKRFGLCFHTGCPYGCGSCCEHFVPDMTDTEAALLAFGLISEGLDGQVLENIRAAGDRDGCIFYNPDTPYHCTVYRWRPMVCRLFGASAVENKEGKAVFRHCRWNTSCPEPCTEELEQHPEALVLMEEYGLLLEEIAPDDTERTLLPVALERAIDKIRFLMEIEESSHS